MKSPKTEKDQFIIHYKKNAKDYDVTRDYRNSITRYFYNKQVDFVLSAFKNVDNIVEVGAGTGKFTIPLALAGKHVRVIDSSQEMLDILVGKANKHGVSDRISVELGDIEDLNLPDCSAEAVLSIALVRHLGDPSRAVSELSRILMPNGIFVLDYLSKYYFLIPNIFSSIISFTSFRKGSKWFKNYYYSKSQFDSQLEKNFIYSKSFRRFVSIPTALLNLLPSPVVFFLLKLEFKFNVGSIVYVLGVKK
jgi:ubiquinone/menaquinone biosynthesis C-methylase UbiE